LNSLDDVRALMAVEREGITGCITGRAIYEGKLDFAEALKVAAGEP
jgi:phosphoribosylformimino-5-aminoimidazole carboxamide ribotide isomerase